MLLLSSQADQVTRRLYPLGIRVAGWLQESKPQDRQLLWETAANYGPYVTHRLTLVGGSPEAFGTDDACACPSVRAEQFSIVRGIRRAERREDVFQYRDVRVTAEDNTLSFAMVLEDVTPDQVPPVMVVEADSRIIRDHGDVYNPLLVEFATRVTNASLQEQGSLMLRPGGSKAP